MNFQEDKLAKMAGSPTSIENQIDSFLEQFKRSASRAMEEHHRRSSLYNASSISRSRSGNLDLEVLEAGEIFMQFFRSIPTRLSTFLFFPLFLKTARYKRRACQSFASISLFVISMHWGSAFPRPAIKLYIFSISRMPNKRLTQLFLFLFCIIIMRLESSANSRV